MKRFTVCLVFLWGLNQAACASQPAPGPSPLSAIGGLLAACVLSVPAALVLAPGLATIHKKVMQTNEGERRNTNPSLANQNQRERLASVLVDDNPDIEAFSNELDRDPRAVFLKPIQPLAVVLNAGHNWRGADNRAKVLEYIANYDQEGLIRFLSSWIADTLADSIRKSTARYKSANSNRTFSGLFYDAVVKYPVDSIMSPGAQIPITQLQQEVVNALRLFDQSKADYGFFELQEAQGRYFPNPTLLDIESIAPIRQFAVLTSAEEPRQPLEYFLEYISYAVSKTRPFWIINQLLTGQVPEHEQAAIIDQMMLSLVMASYRTAQAWLGHPNRTVTGEITFTNEQLKELPHPQYLPSTEEWLAEVISEEKKVQKYYYKYFTLETGRAGLFLWHIEKYFGKAAKPAYPRHQ